MKVLIHVLFIACIMMGTYAIYGAWRKDFARQVYEKTRRYLPFLLFGPMKDLRFYSLLYKVVLLFALFAVIASYIMLLSAFL